MTRFLIQLLFLLLLLPNRPIAQVEDDSLVFTTDSLVLTEPSDMYTMFPFLKEEANKVGLGKADALSHFFRKLQRLEMEQLGKVKVLHIGDSHLQADYFSGRMRQLFAEDIRFPVNERGFLFPYRLAKTNNPPNYKVEYTGSWDGKSSARRKEFSRWGLAGISASTFSEEASFTIKPNVDEQGRADYTIQRVKVFFPVYNEKSFEVKVTPEKGNSLTSFLMGDGFVEFALLKPQSEVTIALEKTSEQQNQFVLQGVSLENNESGLSYSASGVNSATLESYSRCEDFQKHLAQVSPDLVIISLGTNDAYLPNGSFNQNLFKEDYRKMIQKIRQVLPNTSILLTSVADNFRRRRYTNKNNELVAETVKELSQEMGLAYWDFYEIMGGFKSMKLWKDHSLAASDLVHFSRMGYELQGELFYNALDRAYTDFSQSTE